MSTESLVSGQLKTLQVYEATVRGVDYSTGEVLVSDELSEVDAPVRIPPVYFGGALDSGYYQHPDIGDKVLLVRVHPGAGGVTQALRVIPKNSTASGASSQSPSGASGYPVPGLKKGEVRIKGLGGGVVQLHGTGDGSEIGGVYIGNYTNSGIYLYNSNTKKSNLTLVSHAFQSASDAHRNFSRDVFRPEKYYGSSSVSVGHSVLTYPTDSGTGRGLFEGIESSSSSMLGAPRNPALSEHRLVINEVSESAVFRGWDVESSLTYSKQAQSFQHSYEAEAISPWNTLHLSPHQLIEVIGGNVVNGRGEVLDPNYGVVRIGDANGMPLDGDPGEVYEKARRVSRRGLGYHFQLSTNSSSGSRSNDYNNFIMALDKEGALKINVPKTSKTGNVLFPTNASFYSESNRGAVITGPDNNTLSRKERVPVTLRDHRNKVVFPKTGASAEAQMSDDDGLFRLPGIRFSNDDNYFQGFGRSTDVSSENIRVNPTKHHNMYAAAEMLIANTISSVIIPFDNATCTGYIPGNSIGKAFERRAEDYGANGSDKTEVNYMSAIGVFPAAPAVDPGGGVFVAGQDLTAHQDASGSRVNTQYTNSFSVDADDGKFSSANTDSSGESRKNPGGKSANIDFQGSIELSVGKDNHDEKSILLDTAGAMVAWFGTDKNGRSMVVQTDGDVAINVGGTNGDEFNPGKFDLRVNVTHKGFVGDDTNVTNASDYIISISEQGLVIAGMNPGVPMVIRNDGNISLESTAKLILQGQTVEVREGNRPARKTYKDPVSIDTPDATAESVPEQITCIIDALQELEESFDE